MALKKRVTIATLALTMTACSAVDSSPGWYSLTSSEADQINFLQAGSISISRPVPLLESEPARVMAFMPVLPKIPELSAVETNDQKLSIIIDITNKTLRVNRGSENLLESEMALSDDIVKGEYSVTLKQTSPLWYAPDDYFLMRGQEPPAEGSSERYRQGALGTHGIFLTEGLVIHSSPIPDPLVAGFQVSGDKMASIYSILEPGMHVTIL